MVFGQSIFWLHCIKNDSVIEIAARASDYCTIHKCRSKHFHLKWAEAKWKRLCDQMDLNLKILLGNMNASSPGPNRWGSVFYGLCDQKERFSVKIRFSHAGIWKSKRKTELRTLDKVCKRIVKRGGKKLEAWLTENRKYCLRWQEKGCILRPKPIFYKVVWHQFQCICQGIHFHSITSLW